MKKTIIILSVFAAGMMLAACNKEVAPVEKTPLTIQVAMVDNDDTKTDLNLSTLSLTWNSTDKIYLMGAHSGSAFWKLNEFDIIPGSIRDGNKKATFSEVGTPKDWSGVTKFCAVYGKIMTGSAALPNDGIRIQGDSPAPVGNDYSGVGQNYVGIYYPINQVYNAAGPDPQYLYMISDVVDNPADIVFHNVCSLVKIPVKGTSTTLSSIKLTVGGHGYGVAGAHATYRHTNVELQLGSGQAVVGPSYGNNYNFDPWDGSTGTFANWVMLSGINEALTSTPKYFYLIIAPGEHSNKITITLTDNANNSKDFNYSEYLTTEGGKIYNLPVIDWDSK